ncbi:MAG: enoyl-CoA hydratase/isomerase family protein [candidate division Zixibacteria bacterium]|nr:enoyl-CoA hydratase/isomerase family protein [candidate division Zixibacteria bacterium]
MTANKKYETIKVEFIDRIARVTLNRPDVRNAFNAAMIADMADAFKTINKADNLRVVVLTGEGSGFCAGADLNWMKGVVNYTYEENLQDSQNLADMFQLMANCPLPTVARVNGPAIGGGTGMVAVCDIVVASPKAVFSLSEVKIGLVPACISPYVIRRMGDKNCREYFLTGERLTAEKGLAAGLVNYVVPEDKLDEKVEQLVKQLISSGPEALSWCKKLLSEVPGMARDKAGTYTAEVITKLRLSDEGQEGMKAFFEKRKPDWCGDV